MALELEDIRALFDAYGSRAYGKEAVTQLEHALQTAHLGEAEGAEQELIVASVRRYGVSPSSTCRGFLRLQACKLSEQPTQRRRRCRSIQIAADRCLRAPRAQADDRAGRTSSRRRCFLRPAESLSQARLCRRETPWRSSAGRSDARSRAGRRERCCCFARRRR